MLNLNSSITNTCFVFVSSTAASPYTIDLISEDGSIKETKTVTLTAVRNRSQFEITTSLENCDGKYIFYANAIEQERGVIKVTDGTSPVADIEHDPRA